MTTSAQRGRLINLWAGSACVCLCLTLCCSSAIASKAPLSLAHEGQLRAAVTVGVLRFTSWNTLGQPPANDASAGSSIELCLVGTPVSEPFLLPVDGETHIGDKQLSVRRAKKSRWLGCRVFVIGKHLRKGEAEALFDFARKQHILTLCDGCSLPWARRTMIQLKRDRRRITFDVNLINVNAAAIHLDASLLELASKVRR